LLASGSFGDSLNHAYKSESEQQSRRFLYSIDRTSELNIKAHLLKAYSEDKDGSFLSQMVTNGLYPEYVEEARKNYEAAIDALNDLFTASRKTLISREVVVDADPHRLKQYLETCLTFERFGPHETKGREFNEMNIKGPFYARTLTMNYRRILYDMIAVNLPGRNRHRSRR
ncbi:MAG TPA: hypothetical protein VFJ63_00675, partial [Candidatus Bathyarchaeia archaeon]|nr:hypothetical protein [Candidatus Bathyarchaeia archaeon]